MPFRATAAVSSRSGWRLTDKVGKATVPAARNGPPRGLGPMPGRASQGSHSQGSHSQGHAAPTRAHGSATALARAAAPTALLDDGEDMFAAGGGGGAASVAGSGRGACFALG